uniref:Uncharacterized protein n=1 Tax=Panagrolaimus sp. ES5 TaxID=591445 RepID=A0AC34G8A3_9BILA
MDRKLVSFITCFIRAAFSEINMVEATLSTTSSDVRRMMERLNLQPIPAVMAEKKAVGTLGITTQKVVTNIHGLKVPSNLEVYRYDVTIQAVRQTDHGEKVIDLTKKARSDEINMVEATLSTTSSDVRRMMERLNLQPIPAVMAEKKAVGTLGITTQKVVTNIHGLKVPSNLEVYRYDVTIQAVRQTDHGEKVIDLTKKARSDAIVTNRKDLCRSIFDTAVLEHPDVFGPKDQTCYDLQSTLFSPKIITEAPDGVTFDVTNPLVVEKLPGSRAQIKIKPVKDTRVLDASELTRLSSSLDEVDHSLQQYLELETSQTALMNPGDHITYPGGKSFLMNPGAFGFTPRDTPDLGHGKFLGIGCQKSIR